MMARNLRGMSGKHVVRELRAASAVGLRSDGVRSDLKARCVAIFIAVLLAFSWQSFVAQTHVHFSAGGDSAAAPFDSGVSAGTIARSPSSDQPADCPICDEIAHAGHIYLPASLSFHLPAFGDAWIVLAAAGILAPSQSSHAWNSRAPPHILQA
jgi:hypothetical protein